MERLTIDSAAGARIWIKRDDRTGNAYGGNKVRSLEFLLADVRPGDEVWTAGGLGSTHALATAIHAGSLGARVRIFRWHQEMNEHAEATSRRLLARGAATSLSRSAPLALARALLARLTRTGRGSPRVHWVPAGATSPLGMLGHVNAGLELARQIEHGEMPAPDRIVLPLGTGGTAAGIALGCAIAGLHSRIVAVRVVPRVVANRVRLRWLMRSTARLIGRVTQERIPLPPANRVRIVHAYYGGAYGRATAAGRAAAALGAIPLDYTYSAKACAAALAEPEGNVLFWLTFDARVPRANRFSSGT